MAKAPGPEIAAEEIVFELERFELREGQRLELSGRWFGVRGRRFVRPTLTLEDEGERFRALADLEHKPWPAEDGEPWIAAFPLRDRLHVHESELSVAPDITVRLPAPDRKRSRSRRLIAAPRRHSMTESWPELAEVRDLGDPATVPGSPSPESQLEELSAEVEQLRAELEQLRAELGQLQAERETVSAELEAAQAHRDAAAKDAEQAVVMRDAAVAEQTKLASELAPALGELARLRAELDRLRREHEAAVASRGAALVMRGATRAEAGLGPRSWATRGLALLVFIGVVCALLIVLHVL